VSLLKRDDLVPALRAWIYASGSGEGHEASVPAALRWLRAIWDAGDDHLPLGLVHDLGHLLLQGHRFRFASSRDLGTWPADERAARLAYEDRVLGRWAIDPSAVEAHVILAGIREDHRQAAIAHALRAALSRRLGGVPGFSSVRGNPAHLRAVSEEELLAPSPPPPAWIAWAFAQLDAACTRLVDGHLFSPEDLWEIAHLPQLPTESSRLALREIHGAIARIGAMRPETALSMQRRAREVPVDRDTSDQYPAGGFDAISTRGSFESLVRSEVSYVGVTAVGRIDLFDLRFVEGELLYYTRDESPLLDARREVSAIIDRPAELRHKVPLLSAQTLVIAQAIALVVQADLVALYGPHGSMVRLLFRAPSEEDRAVAAEERALLSLALAAELAHGRVALAVASDWDEVPARGRIVISPSPAVASLPCLAWVRVGDEALHLGEVAYPLGGGDASLRALADGILAAIAAKG
jgi:hypothetical protein